MAIFSNAINLKTKAMTPTHHIVIERHRKSQEYNVILPGLHLPEQNLLRTCRNYLYLFKPILSKLAALQNNSNDVSEGIII